MLGIDVPFSKLSGAPPGLEISVPGILPECIQNGRTPLSPYLTLTDFAKRRRAKVAPTPDRRLDRVFQIKLTSC
jgi:hypothetical protein